MTVMSLLTASLALDSLGRAAVAGVKTREYFLLLAAAIFFHNPFSAAAPTCGILVHETATISLDLQLILWPSGS